MVPEWMSSKHFKFWGESNKMGIHHGWNLHPLSEDFGQVLKIRGWHYFCEETLLRVKKSF